MQIFPMERFGEIGPRGSPGVALIGQKKMGKETPSRKSLEVASRDDDLSYLMIGLRLGHIFLLIQVAPER